MRRNGTENRISAVTAAEMKEFDRRTIEDMGVPSMVLMERAALACFDELVESSFDLTQTTVVCGTGNNGGDGVAIARLLYLAGHDVTILPIGSIEKYSRETSLQHRIATNYGVKYGAARKANAQQFDDDDIKRLIARSTTIVDAIFGIGLTRDVEGDFRMVIESITRSTADVLAVDIPSGLSTDTGDVLGVAVRARKTVTFAFPKVGLEAKKALPYVGELTVKDIGIYRNLG